MHYNNVCRSNVYWRSPGVVALHFQFVIQSTCIILGFFYEIVNFFPIQNDISCKLFSNNGLDSICSDCAWLCYKTYIQHHLLGIGRQQWTQKSWKQNFDQACCYQSNWNSKTGKWDFFLYFLSSLQHFLSKWTDINWSRDCR